MNKCKFCGSEGIIRNIGGLYYAQCSNCDNHTKHDNDQYQYMGNTISNCIYVWNINNPEKGKYKPSSKNLHKNII